MIFCIMESCLYINLFNAYLVLLVKLLGKLLLQHKV